MRSAEELIDRALEGHPPGGPRLISRLGRQGEDGDAILNRLHAEGGKAHIIGVTGAAGSGKSTLVTALARELRSRDRTVGIVAVDPSSSITGGSILGDRIRMTEHALDKGVFVQAAHTVAVVSVPGMGDDIQAIKAGLLEIADLHVVNKADRPEADRTVSELRTMLSLQPTGAWAPPILETVARTGAALPELADAFDHHRGWLRDSGELERRERRAAAARVAAVAQDLLLEELESPSTGDAFERAVDDVQHRRTDPRTAGRNLIRIAAGGV